MLKLRITGTLEEAGAFADALEATGHVLNRSRPYPNRGVSGYVRVYMDVDVRPDRAEKWTSASVARAQVASKASTLPDARDVTRC